MVIVTYLCLMAFLVSYSFPGVGGISCPRGWLRIQRNCYAYIHIPKTWFEAEVACQSYGPGIHLASILTELESVLLANYISAMEKKEYDVWIGLHDPDKNGKWKWFDYSVFNYNNWKQREPNNYGGKEYCVELRRSTGFQKWNDEPCDNLNTYICKQKL